MYQMFYFSIIKELVHPTTESIKQLVHPTTESIFTHDFQIHINSYWKQNIHFDHHYLKEK